MKKITMAMLGISLLSGSVVFAQSTSSDSASSKSTMKTKHKKSKKGSSGTTETGTASSPK